MYVLLTRAPVSFQSKSEFSLDLHVLSLPLAFILSQDQTLHSKYLYDVSSTVASFGGYHVKILLAP